MKILYIATSDVHLATFHKPYVKWLDENRVQVDIAVEKRGDFNFEGVKNAFYLDFPRSLMNKKLFSSYKKLKQIIDSDFYDLIHCHTPIPSMLARLAAREARKKGAKVLYTAHGFHFYKGAPLTKWLLYYTAEYFLSLFTDGIITINKEDYGYISGKMLHKSSFYIKGIGVDSNKFKPFSINERLVKRKSIGLRNKDFVLMYVAEFISRKNHQFLIRSLNDLVKIIPEIKLVLAGKGMLLDEMKQLAQELGVSEYIYFLGFRTDINELSAIADIGISSSKHEGLGLGLAEEMMCKIPIVASADKGHKEMVVPGETGYLFEQNNQKDFIKYITLLYNDSELRYIIGEKAYLKAQEFEIANSLDSMKTIYKQYLEDL